MLLLFRVVAVLIIIKLTRGLLLLSLRRFILQTIPFPHRLQPSPHTITPPPRQIPSPLLHHLHLQLTLLPIHKTNTLHRLIENNLFELSDL